MMTISPPDGPSPGIWSACSPRNSARSVALPAVQSLQARSRLQNATFAPVLVAQRGLEGFVHRQGAIAVHAEAELAQRDEVLGRMTIGANVRARQDGGKERPVADHRAQQPSFL